MAFFDKISKTVYTDAIQNIGWQPYTCFRGDRCYFSYKEEGLVLLEETADLIKCYEQHGIKIRPISDLIDNVYIKDLIEISSTDYILNNKYCHSQIKNSSFTFNRLGVFLGIPTSRFAVEGFYFNDLSLKDIIRFKSVPFVYKTIKYYDKKIGETEMPLKSKIELFLQVNEYGEHVSQEHLEKIKNAYL